MIVKVTGELGNKRIRSNYYIIENDQNTEKNPGNLRILAVTKTPVKDDLLTLMWKIKVVIK